VHKLKKSRRVSRDSVTPSANLQNIQEFSRVTRSGLVLPVVSRSHVLSFTTDGLGIRRAHDTDTVETGPGTVAVEAKNCLYNMYHKKHYHYTS